MKKFVYVILGISILCNVGLAAEWINETIPKADTSAVVREIMLSSIHGVSDDLISYEKLKSKKFLEDASWKLSYASGLAMADHVLTNNNDVGILSFTLSGFGDWLQEGKHVSQVESGVAVLNDHLSGDNFRKVAASESLFEKQVRVALNHLSSSQKQGDD